MKSERRQEAHREISTYSDEEKKQMERASQKGEERLQKKLQRQEKIKQSSEYKLIEKTAFLMDKCYLDPLLGIFLPEIGDILTQILVFPSLSLSMFTIRSIPLTLTIISNSLLDVVISMVPVVGDIIDFFDKSFQKNYVLIKEYVEGNQEVIKKVNRRAIWTVIAIAIMIYLIYLLWKLFHSLILSVIGLIHSGIDFIMGLF